MDNILKILVLVIVLIYMVSPVDAVPGPIDDVIVLLLGFVVNHRIANKE